MKKIPQGWTLTRIGEVCEVVRGASPRPAGDPRYFDGDYLPWITVAEVTSAYGMHLEKTKSFLTEEGAKFTRTIPPNTLILTNSGATLGVPKITKIKAGANDGIAMLLNPAGVTNEYLYFVLESRTDYFRNHLAPGNGQPNLNTDLIKEEPLLLPSISEQSRIADLGVLWNKSIEDTERLIAAKEQRHRALLIRLLGKRLWSESRHERADTLFNPLSERNRPDLPVLAVTQDQGVVPRAMLDRRITMELSDPATFKVVRKDDFVISLRSFQGGLEHSVYDGLVSPAYTVVRCGSTLLPRFYRHYLKSPDFLKRLAVAVVGIRDGKQINFADFASIRLPLPSPERQQVIAAVLDESEQEIALLKRQADKLRQQKCGLMQKLLTGKRRVPVAEAEAA